MITSVNFAKNIQTKMLKYNTINCTSLNHNIGLTESAEEEL